MNLPTIYQRLQAARREIDQIIKIDESWCVGSYFDDMLRQREKYKMATIERLFGPPKYATRPDIKPRPLEQRMKDPKEIIILKPHT